MATLSKHGPETDYNARVREQQRAAKSIGEPGLPNFNIIKP